MPDRATARRRLAHVALLVRDYDEARDWFVRRLGFVLVEDTPLAPGKRWVVVAPADGGGTSLLLARAATPAQEAAIGRQGGGRVFLFLDTDDFPRDHAAFRAAGVAFTEPPREEAYGTVAVFVDLHGNRWDLVQRRPAPAPSTPPRAPLHVRPARVEDAAAIAECLAPLGYGTPAALVAERLAAFASSAADVVLVAGDGPDGTPLGVASAHALPLFHEAGQLVRLTALGVRDDARRRGVGRALVAGVEAWAWRVGARRVEVTSGDHRAAAHAFYAALGYALDERRFVKRVPPDAR